MFWVNRALYLSRILFVLVTLLLWPLIFVLNFNSYPLTNPQTIFEFDYQARQQVLRNTYAYPNIPLARLFQNKAQIPIGKFEHNLTALIDPNNYFFGFHPREILTGNANAVKFPFVALPVFLLGFFGLSTYRHRKAVSIFIIVGVILLSLLANFDGYDFFLYFPLAYVFLSGQKRIPPVYFLAALPFAVIELIRQIIIFGPK